MDRIACVLIDWHGTLSHSLFWETWQTGTTGERRMAALLQDAMFGDNHHLLSPWMRGDLTSKYVVARAAVVAGIPFEIAMKGFVASCMSMRFVSDAVLPQIAILRSRGFCVGIAPDNMDSFTRWTVPALGLDRHVDVVLNSSVLGAMKGERRQDGYSPFFSDFRHARGFARGTTVILDDSQDIADIAEASGMVFRKITSEHTVISALGEFI